MVTPENRCPIVCPDKVPTDLVESFWKYDDALLTNDIDTLNELFMPGPDAVRGDGMVFLVGREQISSFRSSRASPPSRDVEQLHICLLGTDEAVVLARTRDGVSTGLQTQVWQKRGGRWLIFVAHMSLPSSP